MLLLVVLLPSVHPVSRQDQRAHLFGAKLLGWETSNRPERRTLAKVAEDDDGWWTTDAACQATRRACFWACFDCFPTRPGTRPRTHARGELGRPTRRAKALH